MLHRHAGPQLTVDYWLPVTKVNVTGSVVTATRTADNSVKHTRTPAVVSVVTRPDYSRRYQVTMASDDWATHAAKIELQADARLASADASIKSGRAGVVQDVLKFAVMGAGLGFAAGGPPGLLFGGTAGLAAAVVTLAVADTAADEALTPKQKAAAQDAAESDYYKKLNILQKYVDDHSKDACQLADLRIAEAKARLDFAAAAKSPDGTRALQSIHQRLQVIRAELALSEAIYQKWLDSTLETTTVSYDEEITIADLPGWDGKPVADAVKAWYCTEPEPDAPLPTQRFHTACKALGIAIGCEPSETDPTASLAPPQGAPTAHGQVYYRALRPGVLRVYAALEDEDKAPELQVRSSQRVLVAAPGDERTVPLLAGKADRSLTVAFDATGALTSISTEVTGAALGAASALGELPSALKDAFAAGADLAKPFSAEGRAKTLQDELDEKKARAELSAGADPDQKLKEDVARAELEARLKVANELASGGASTAVVVMGGTSG
jgi:hypothetical protein